VSSSIKHAVLQVSQEEFDAIRMNPPPRSRDLVGIPVCFCFVNGRIETWPPFDPKKFYLYVQPYERGTE